MVELQKLVRNEVMTERVEIYVPSTRNDTETLTGRCYFVTLTDQEHEEETLKTTGLFTSLFGGATYGPVFGAWLMQSGEIVREKIHIVYSFCTTHALKKHFKRVISEAERIKAALKQDAVTVVVNRQAILV